MLLLLNVNRHWIQNKQKTRQQLNSTCFVGAICNLTALDVYLFIFLFQQVWFKNRRAKVRQQSKGEPKPKPKPKAPTVSKDSSQAGPSPCRYASCGNIWSPAHDSVRPMPTYPSHAVINNSMAMSTASPSFMPPPPPPPYYCSSPNGGSYMPLEHAHMHPMAPR